MSVLVCCLSLSLVITSSIVGSVSSEESQEYKHDFDGKMGTTQEFKVEILAGKEECFYQFAAEGAQFFLSYEVIRGSDRMLNFYLIQGGEVMERQYHTDGSVSLTIEISDYYQMCFDNMQSRFGSKLVYVYLVTLVTQGWESYANEIKELDQVALNLTSTLAGVELSLIDMDRYQTNSRLNVIRDWYLIRGNNIYINYWSIAQSVLVVLAAAAQVIFLRRLFTVPVVTKTSKPRA